MNNVFPNIIKQLPEAGLGIEGLRIRISHADSHEVWFLESDIELDYPPHAHAAQWGVVLEGTIQVTMDNQTQCFSKGDRYFLPEGVEHSVKLSAGYAEIIFLNDPNLLGR